MPDNLDELRAAILRMQGWKSDPYAAQYVGLCPWFDPNGRWFSVPPDPLADDRLHELVALARQYGRLIRLWTYPSAKDVYADISNDIDIGLGSGSGPTDSIALARAIVEAKAARGGEL